MENAAHEPGIDCHADIIDQGRLTVSGGNPNVGTREDFVAVGLLVRLERERKEQCAVTRRSGSLSRPLPGDCNGRVQLHGPRARKAGASEGGRRAVQSVELRPARAASPRCAPAPGAIERVWQVRAGLCRRRAVGGCSAPLIEQCPRAGRSFSACATSGGDWTKRSSNPCCSSDASGGRSWAP